MRERKKLKQRGVPIRPEQGAPASPAISASPATSERKLTVELTDEELRRTVVALWAASENLNQGGRPYALRLRGSEYEQLARRLDAIFRIRRFESTQVWVAE